MTVDEILAYAFDSSRQWRSYEYKNGVKAVLEFGINKKVPYMRDAPGTAAVDAFLSGMEEGWALLEHFGIGRDAEVAAGEWHRWIEEQRGRVVANLRTTRDPMEEAGLVRSLNILQSAGRQPPPGRAARYPWETATFGQLSTVRPEG